jgi:hypothetical protein
VKLLAGSGIGAALMFLFDPARGRRRRAVGRDKATRWMGRGRDVMEKAGRDLAHRASGAVAAAKSHFSREDVDDSLLEARVRTQLGRAVSHPGSIDVFVDNGVVTLCGPVLKREVDYLLKSVSSVPGVQRLRNELDEHDQAGDVPGLQGGYRRRRASELMQENWTPGIRLLMGTAGGALAAWGIVRRDPLSIAAASVGASLITRAVTNKSFTGQVRPLLQRGREQWHEGRSLTRELLKQGSR